MAKSVLDIVIKLSKEGGADKETIKGLVSLKSAILNAAAVAGTLVAAGYAIKKAYDEVVNAALAYGDQVRRTGDETGLNAEQSSKLIQVLDDLKISYDDLDKVIQKNGKNFDFSVEGLAKMSAQYQSLTDTQEKAAFMQERFGKSWGQWVEVMKQGPDALMKMGDAIDKNLILTQKEIDAQRQYQKNLDDVNDSIEGFKVSVGNQVIPVVNQAFENQKHYNEALQEVIRLYGDHGDRANNMRVKLILEKDASLAAADAVAAHGDALDGVVPKLEAAAQATEDLSLNTKDYLSLAQNLTDENSKYQESVAQVTSDDSLSADERIAKLKELEDAHTKATNTMIFNLLLQKGASLDVALAYGEATGIIDEKSAQQARDYDAISSALAGANGKIYDMKQAIDLLQDKHITITVDQIVNMQRADALANWADKKQGFATGGSFTIPSIYGNEGFSMGGIATASAGETVTISPKGQGGSGSVMVNVNVSSPVTVLDQQTLDRVLLPAIVRGVQQARSQGAIK